MVVVVVVVVAVVVVVLGRTHFFADRTFGSNIASRAGQTLELSGIHQNIRQFGQQQDPQVDKTHIKCCSFQD